MARQVVEDACDAQGELRPALGREALTAGWPMKFNATARGSEAWSAADFTVHDQEPIAAEAQRGGRRKVRSQPLLTGDLGLCHVPISEQPWVSTECRA